MTVRITPGGKVTFQRNTKTTIRPPLGTMSAVGGNSTFDIVVNGLAYRVHRFTSSGILTVTSANNDTATFEYLSVAGGGGGTPSNGGGGGAGGFLSGTISVGIGSYVVNVGGGGGASTPGSPSFIQYPASMGSLDLVLSIGGGRGSGGDGGSGGGARNNSGFGLGNPLQGNPGGAGNLYGGGGGGGGAGSAGVPAFIGVGIIGGGTGPGGTAKETTISGIPEWFAAGGGGSAPQYSQGNAGFGGYGGTIELGGRGNGGHAVVQTGSGGGANYSGTAGNGSTGIVIIRYRIS